MYLATAPSDGNSKQGKSVLRCHLLPDRSAALLQGLKARTGAMLGEVNLRGGRGKGKAKGGRAKAAGVPDDVGWDGVRGR